MMIAFYFGSKSLEMIGYKSKRIHGAGNEQNGSSQQSNTIQQTPVPPSANASLAKNILKKGSASAKPPDKEKEQTSINSDFDIPGAAS